MYTARYKTDNSEINIDAQDMTRNQYEQLYKGNLFCEYGNCDAEIVFNERQKGGFLRYFSTKPGSNHKPGCRHEIFHNGSKSPVIRVRGNDVNVSDKHINDVLSDAYKNFYNKLFSIKTKKSRPSSKNNNKNTKKTDENEEPIVSAVSMPLANGSGQTIVEGKEPYIYKREISDIKNDDKNSCKEVHALVDGIRIYENEVFIDLKGLDGNQFCAYIGTPFKTMHEQEFNLLRNFESYIMLKKQINQPIICTSFGEIMELEKKTVIQIYNYRHIKLDNLGFYQIINSLS